MSTDHPPRAIWDAAVAMAGGPELWNGLGPEIRNQYIAMAEAAAPALMGGGAIPWPDVQRTVEFVLSQNRGMQTAKKPDDVAVTMLAMKLVEHMRGSGYTVFAGRPADAPKTHGPKG
ncbi:hypothetical protein [Azospirillum formosense]|uniref:hypothetical protein n=1 Tax=Azospirillum formosense TaxID=861533 RepID=UPI00338D6070